MASGRTNAGIAAKLYLSQRAVEKHSHAIFRKLGLGEDLDINQRVSAVLFFLEQQAD
jgi:DNA-binding NarL/FixJ family response regulator